MSEADVSSQKFQNEGRPKKTAEQQQKQQKALLILIILIIVGAVMILYRNGVIGGSASRAPVEKYFQAIAAKDFDSFTGSMPPKMAEYDHVAVRDDLGLSGEEYMRQLYGDYFTEFGDDMTITLEFTDRSRLEALYVDNFKESYREIYGEDISIRSSFEIDVTAHFSGSKSSDDIDLECFVIKSGGKWYIVGCDYKTVDADE